MIREEAQEEQVELPGIIPAIVRWDNPETVRLRKYLTGTHVLLEHVGVETGRTPHEVVWEKDKVKVRLYRYGAGEAKRHRIPLLLVYALVLRPYILDLVPGRSLVEHLARAGFDVYLLDFGIPGDEDRYLSLESYVLGYLDEAVEVVHSTSATKGVSLLGYCMGGTLSAMYAALRSTKVKNLVLLAAPIDFAPPNPGALSIWRAWNRQRWFGPDLVVETLGNFPGDAVSWWLDATRPLLRSFPLPADLLGGIRDAVGRDPSIQAWLGVCKWVDEGIPFPGRAFGEWSRDFYRENRLVKGELRLRGDRVELSKITCPIVSIAGTMDFVTPRAQAEPAVEMVGSQDKASVVLDAGHLGLMVGPAGKWELWPRLTGWLERRS